MNKSTSRSSGFSLIELVIVVVIIGIIAAIAIPRLSRGAAGAGDSALKGDLKVLRTAIDLFATEHGGTYPTQAAIVAQLTTYSDASGNTNASQSSTFMYGPYLRSIPPLPVGAKKGQTGIAAATGGSVGWVYDPTAGTIIAGSAGAETDVAGVAYNTY